MTSLFISLPLFAQSALVGGNISFGSSSTTLKNSNRETETSNTNFNLSGSYSHLLSKNLALGGELTFSHNSSGELDTSIFSVGGNGYYFLQKIKTGAVSAYGTSGAGFTLGDFTSFYFRVGLGGLFPIRKNVALDLMIPLTFSFGDKDDLDITTFQFGMNLGFSILI